MIALTTLLADVDRWNHMDGSGGGAWMALWGTFMMAALVLFVVWMVRTNDRSRQPQTHPADTARKILADRYARGEISTEEYRERVDALQ